MKLFLDTNIFIDYITKREEHYKPALILMLMQEIGDAELWLSSESFTDTFYACLKVIGKEKLQNCFLACLDFINVCGVDQSDIRLAAERKWPDFEDCIINICAEKVKADYLITRNVNDFKQSKLPVYTSSGFLKMLERDYGIVYDLSDF